MGFVEFLFETKRGKTLMAMIYGIGGSIVIIGALFKIMHWPGASAFLIIGLGTEALIFAISAFEPPHTDVDWTLVYPELGGLDEDSINSKISSSATEELDSMFKEANIDSQLIQNLGEGMKKLAENADNLSEVSDVSEASEKYSSSLKTASDKLENMSGKYSEVSETLTGLSEASSSGKEAGESLQKITGTLSELYSVYESQLNTANEHTEKMNSIFDGVTSVVENLHQSAQHAEQYKENMAHLSDSLATLNRVYGNMVSAMNPNNAS